MNRCAPPRRSHRAASTLLPLVMVVMILASGLGLGIWFWLPRRASIDDSVITTAVRRGPFAFDVIERGEIESASNVEVRCEVKSRGSGGMTILEVAEEGTLVNKGDVLVQLDSSSLEQDLVQQQIQCNANEAQMITSRNTFETAQIAKQEYMEGTFYQEEQQLNSEILITEEALRRAQEYLEYSERLAARGYVTPQQLEGDRFAVDKARVELEVSRTKLRVLQEYTKPKMVMQLESDIRSAEAAWKADESSYQLELSRLKEIEEQIAKCIIRAPEAGQVIHANEQSSRSGSEFIVEPGATVREGQTIIRLPDAKEMQVKAKVNESRITDLTAGMPATVRVDAFGDKTFRGEVTKVNEYPEPTGWYSSQVKEYATLIRILDNVGGLRPGLTAEAKIHVLRIPDALQIPVQAVFEHGRKPYVIVKLPAGGWEAREITIHANNDKFVLVDAGADEGEIVAMNPSPLMELVTLPAVPEEVAAGPGPDGDTAEGRQAEGVGERGREGRPATDGSGPGGAPGGAPGAAQGGGRPRGATPGGDPAAVVTMIMSRMDTNGDEQIASDELVGEFADRLKESDANGDGVIDRAELLSALRNRMREAADAPGSAP